MSEIKKNHADLLKKLHNYKSPLSDRSKLHAVQTGKLHAISVNDMPSNIQSKGFDREANKGRENVFYDPNGSFQKQVNVIQAAFFP